MKILPIIFFGLLAMGFIIWIGDIFLALAEMDEQEVLETFKFEEEQESCQNGGNPAKRDRK